MHEAVLVPGEEQRDPVAPALVTIATRVLTLS